MKTITRFTLVFFLSLTLLVACGGNPPDLEDRTRDTDDTPVVAENGTYTGVIESLEIDIYQQGTHQLITDTDGAIIIQSRTIDLNRYLGKKVVVEGEYVETMGSIKPVLNVTDIRLGEGEMTDDVQKYESNLFGLAFEYPAVWDLQEGGGKISLNEGETKWVTIEIFNDQSDLGAFAASQEEGEGDSITVGAQGSLRYMSDMSLRFYVPNPPKKKIYRITLHVTGDSSADEGAKEYFFRLLESVELIYRTVQSGEKCGGKENIACAEGYLCELRSAEEDAEGICTSLNPDDVTQNCPYIAPPANCGDYRISAYSKGGCPSRYECMEEATSLREGDFTFLVDESDLGDEYTEEYSDDFMTDTDSEKEDITEETQEQEKVEIPHVSDGMRSYENTRKEYTMEYPKNWYYRSFGAVEGTQWLVGFADKEVDLEEDAVITVAIVDEKPSSAPSGSYQSIVPREADDTYYVVQGPKEMKEVIDAMAKSIK